MEMLGVKDRHVSSSGKSLPERALTRERGKGSAGWPGIWNPWLVTLKAWLVIVPSRPFALPVIRLCELISTYVFPDQFKFGFVSCNPKTPDKHMLELLLEPENHEETRDHSVSPFLQYLKSV